MKLILISVRDRAANTFGNPFAVPGTGVALRSFTDEINNKQSELNKHPEDYDLYQIGTYDTDTGDLTPQRPEQIAIGKNVVIQQ